ncbi:Uncharacterised protein [Mycobacteroides abscessus subsp. abscessus]|nr:Uncharacterised protein [Mycobacteroides abscessus subsp. abscessus]
MARRYECPVSESSAHSGSAGGPRWVQPRGQFSIASWRSSKALTMSSALTCARPNERMPGVSITQPRGLSSSPGSGSATDCVDVWRPLPTPLTTPVARSASGTRRFTNVDFPTPECPMSAVR